MEKTITYDLALSILQTDDQSFKSWFVELSSKVDSVSDNDKTMIAGIAVKMMSSEISFSVEEMGFLSKCYYLKDIDKKKCSPLRAKIYATIDDFCNELDMNTENFRKRFYAVMFDLVSLKLAINKRNESYSVKKESNYKGVMNFLESQDLLDICSQSCQLLIKYTKEKSHESEK